MDAIRKLGQKDVGTAIVHDEKNFYVSHPKVKCFDPFKEHNLCHPNLCVVAVNATQIVEVDILEGVWILGLSNDPQWKFVRTVTIAANGEREAFLVLFLTFQLLGRKRMVGLVGGDWLHIKRTIALDFPMTYNGRTIVLEFKTHMHHV